MGWIVLSPQKSTVEVLIPNVKQSDSLKILSLEGNQLI